MKNKFITSDLHLGHKNIIAYEHRPFSDVSIMNETIITNINSMVKQEDELYILGDFSFMNGNDTLNILKSINCKKFLILGNHDSWILKCKDIMNEFVWVKDYYCMKHRGRKLVMFHYPIQDWDCRHHGSILFYGHIHSNIGPHSVDYNMPNSFNVGVDVNHFYPIDIDYIVSKVEHAEYELEG